jgi:hypothetical protein
MCKVSFDVSFIVILGKCLMSIDFGRFEDE